MAAQEVQVGSAEAAFGQPLPTWERQIGHRWASWVEEHTGNRAPVHYLWPS